MPAQAPFRDTPAAPAARHPSTGLTKRQPHPPPLRGGKEDVPMNYITLLRAFQDRVAGGGISSRAQLLYYTLLGENNRCRWQPWFCRSNATLCGLMHISTHTLLAARRELEDLGLIVLKREPGGATWYQIREQGAQTSTPDCTSPMQQPVQEDMQDAVQEDALFCTGANQYRENKKKQDKTTRAWRAQGGARKRKKSLGPMDFASEGGPSYDLDAYERESIYDTMDDPQAYAGFEPPGEKICE